MAKGPRGKSYFKGFGAVLLLLVAVSLGAASAQAMTFQTVTMKDGASAVVAIGDIVPGDDAGLAAGLARVQRDSSGTKELVLISLGGSVASAFALVAVMDRVGVTTIVPKGAECASACASVLFVSGLYKVVMQGGLLGMHTCYLPGGTPDPDCNDTVAQNAVAHGVAYGSVMAFMQAAGPENAIWFSSSDADCYGLTRWPGQSPASMRPAPCVISAISETLRGLSP